MGTKITLKTITITETLLFVARKEHQFLYPAFRNFLDNELQQWVEDNCVEVFINVSKSSAKTNSAFVNVTLNATVPDILATEYFLRWGAV